MPDLPHLAARLFGRPLCVSRAKLDVILPILVPRLLGQTPRLEQPTDPAQPAPPMVAVPAQIAVVPVFGTLIARGAGVIAMSGETSYEALGAVVSRLAAKPEVGGILLDIDSCGGEYAGLPEFAAELAAAGRQKPIWASVRPACFSAAYWIASQAEKIMVTPSCELGSIGVMAVHVDMSARDEQQGYKLTFFNAGDRKLDGNPHLPINEAFAKEVQAGVDRAYDEFVQAVAQGRGKRFQPKAIRDTEARTYEAADAVRIGMADQVLTFNETIRAFADRLAKGPAPAQPSTIVTTSSNPPTTSLKESAMSKTEGDQPATTAATATPPAAAADVVNLDTVRSAAAAQATTLATDIVEACSLAQKMGLQGANDMATDFIKAATPIADVRKALMTKLAAEIDATAVTGQHGGKPGGTKSTATIDTAGIYAKRAKAMSGRA